MQNNCAKLHLKHGKAFESSFIDAKVRGVIKDVIGRLFWYVLAGTLIASISYNFIINMNCEKTLDQAKKDYSTMFENRFIPLSRIQ